MKSFQQKPAEMFSSSHVFNALFRENVWHHSQKSHGHSHAIPQTCICDYYAVEILWKGAGADNRSEKVGNGTLWVKGRGNFGLILVYDNIPTTSSSSVTIGTGALMITVMSESITHGTFFITTSNTKFFRNLPLSITTTARDIRVTLATSLFFCHNFPYDSV